jgi:hypothetical protein
MTLILTSHVSGHYTFIRQATITDTIELEYYVQHKDAKVVLDQFSLSTEEFIRIHKAIKGGGK